MADQNKRSGARFTLGQAPVRREPGIHLLSNYQPRRGDTVALGLACLGLAGCMPHSIDTIKEAVPTQVKYIMLDAKQYEVLWQRWTVVDWVLGLFAAGTAIAAAIKNAFSAHTQAQGGGSGSNASVKVDRMVMICAALTVIATTLDAKMHAGATAERYRQGDLLLQDAIMDYRLSAAPEPQKQQQLLDVWHQAQRILEGAPAAPPKSGGNAAPSGTPGGSPQSNGAATAAPDGKGTQALP